MQTQIGQYGNSLTIRIPKPFAKDLGIAKGSEVDLRVEDGKLVIEVLSKEKPIVGASPKKLLKFVGRLPKENFEELDTIISDGCERIADACKLKRLT